MLGEDIATCVKKGKSKNLTNQQTFKKTPQNKTQKNPQECRLSLFSLLQQHVLHWECLTTARIRSVEELSLKFLVFFI